MVSDPVFQLFGLSEVQAIAVDPRDAGLVGLSLICVLLSGLLWKCRRVVRIIQVSLGGEMDMAKFHELNRLKKQEERRERDVVSQALGDALDELVEKGVFTNDQFRRWTRRIGFQLGLSDLIPKKIMPAAPDPEILKELIRTRLAAEKTAAAVSQPQNVVEMSKGGAKRKSLR